METAHEVGVVTDYDPDTKMYLVSLDSTGDVQARRVLTGVDKPFPNHARVVCVRTRGLGWSILGELDMPSPNPENNRPQTVDEAVADLTSKVRDIRLANQVSALPNFRDVGEEPQFPGDVSIENRTVNKASRSRVKVYSFGSVLAFASNLCFMLLNRRDSLLLIQCRNYLMRAVGYLKSITTRADDPRLVIREVLQADPLPSQQGTENPRPVKTDRETVEGYVLVAPGTDRAEDVSDIIRAPKVERGLWTKFMDHRAEEIDHAQQVRRIKQDFVTYDSQGRETERLQEITHVEGHIEGEGGSASRGARTVYRDWLEIQVDNEARTITITNLNGPEPHRVVLTDEHTAIERGAQYLRLDDDGLHIRAKNMNVEVEEVIDRKAGQSITDSAPQIHHDS